LFEQLPMLVGHMVADQKSPHGGDFIPVLATLIAYGTGPRGQFAAVPGVIEILVAVAAHGVRFS